MPDCHKVQVSEHAGCTCGRNSHRPALVVLDALIRGHPVDIDGYTYRYHDGHMWLRDTQTTSGQYVLLDTSGRDTLSWFIKACAAMPEEAVVAIGAKLTLSRHT